MQSPNETRCAGGAHIVARRLAGLIEPCSTQPPATLPPSLCASGSGFWFGDCKSPLLRLAASGLSPHSPSGAEPPVGMARSASRRPGGRELEGFHPCKRRFARFHAAFVPMSATPETGLQGLGRRPRRGKRQGVRLERRTLADGRCSLGRERRSRRSKRRRLRVKRSGRGGERWGRAVKRCSLRGNRRTLWYESERTADGSADADGKSADAERRAVDAAERAAGTVAQAVLTLEGIHIS